MTMSLYRDDLVNSLSGLRPVSVIDPGAFEGFSYGTGMGVMKAGAEAGRALSMAGSVPYVLADKLLGGTELSDNYFKNHNEVFQNAVDHWTVKPNEVGKAGQVVGQLLGTLPLVIASPLSAIAATQLSVGEDLAKEGVSSGKAQAVGAVQGAGLGLGVWMPILGANLWQKMVVGGAGFNTVQGVVTRGISGKILEGTKAEDQFKAFDGAAMTLDVLLGLAFGGISHLKGEKLTKDPDVFGKVKDWAQGLLPSQKDAILALKQAEHLNVESMQGKPVDASDITAHVNKMRETINQISSDTPLNIDDMPSPRTIPDEARIKDSVARADEINQEAANIIRDEGVVIPDPANYRPAPKNIANVVEESIKQELRPLQEALFPESLPKTPLENASPITKEAYRIAQENPDMRITIGETATGEKITQSITEYLDDVRMRSEQAQADTFLYEVAADCLLGVV